MAKPKFEKQFAVIESYWEYEGDFPSIKTGGFCRPERSFKTQPKAFAEWKRKTTKWWIEVDISTYFEFMSEFVSDRTYKEIERESAVVSVHLEHSLPDVDATLNMNPNSSKAWRSHFSCLPTRVQHRLIQEFLVYPYEIVEMDVEV